MLTKYIALVGGSLCAVLLLAGWGSAHAQAAGFDATASAAMEATVQTAAATIQTAPTLGSAGTGGNVGGLTPVPQLKCVQFNSTTSSTCKDSGGFDSTCATAKCGAGYTLTGGGGSCSAGNRMVKSLSPNLGAGEFGIMCEKQGVSPKASAICCKL